MAVDLMQYLDFAGVGGSKLVLGLWVIIFGVIAISLMYVVFLFIQYKFKVTVFEKRGKYDQVVLHDYGRIKKSKEGVKKLQLFRSKKVLNLPKYDYLHSVRGGMFQKKELFYYRYGEDSFTPISLNTDLQYDKLNLIPIEGDIAQMVNIMDEIEAKFDHRNFWDKYGTLILHLASFAILFVMLLFVVKGIKSAGESLGSVASSLEGTAKMLSQCAVEAA